jgi:MFS family permease
MAAGAIRALESPRYRRYLSGQVLSLTGTWAQQVTIAWLAFGLTGSSAAVGATLVFAQLPILLLSPLAGVVNDRFDRKHVLLATQLAAAIQALLLVACAAAHALSAIVLFTLSGLAGVISALDTPARQSIVPSLVDRPADIRNAVALSAASVHVARLLGPALAALLQAQFDAQACFLANAMSSLAFCGILVGLPAMSHERIRRISLSSLREGWAYCATHADARRAFFWIATTSTLAIPYTSLLPAALRDWSRPTPVSYAHLMAAAGGGALLAALVLARNERDATLRQAMPLSILASAAGLIALALVGGQIPAALLASVIAGIGFALTLVISGGNVLLQHAAPEALRGRIMGLFVMAFNGAAPVGALMLGIVADRLGVQTALISAATAASLMVVARLAADRR